MLIKYYFSTFLFKKNHIFSQQKKIPSKKITKSQYILVVPNLQSLISTPHFRSQLRYKILSSLFFFSFLRSSIVSFSSPIFPFDNSIYFFFFSLFRFPEQPSYARVATICYPSLLFAACFFNYSLKQCYICLQQ